YSRKIWAQNLLPLFVVGYIFSALLAFIEGRRRWLIVHFGLLTIVAQLHYSGLVFVPLTALLLLIFRRNVDRHSLGAGAALALLPALPFVAYLLSQTSNGISGQMQIPQARLNMQAPELAALVAMGTDIHSLAGPQAFRDYLASVPDFTALFWLGGALTIAGALLALRSQFQSESHHAIRNTQYAIRNTHHTSLILFLWLLLPLLAFLPGLVPVFPHYFILLFPAPYLLAGIALDALLARFEGRPVRVLVWLIPAAIAAAQVWAFAALLSFVGARATPGGFGTPLGLLLHVAGSVRGAPDVIVVSTGTNPGFDETPAVFHALLRGAPHRFVDGRT
ncbi:MAG: hypothetical protein NZM11_11305, partial [Anaerolineales bacterium]|nr:hypothetical protein [Anaerolineales bacterium]